jgi:hypothetical protein
MNTRLTTPTSRLICFGGAKLATNGADGDQPEHDVGGKFE